MYKLTNCIGAVLILFTGFSCWNNAKKTMPVVTARFETTPMPHAVDEDCADDPAVWVNPNNVSQACIIGTDKQGGLAVYDVKGTQLHYYSHGRMNNVDVRYGFMLGGQSIDLVCAGNRDSNSIAIYGIDDGGVLTPLAARTITTKMRGGVYGFCLYKSPKNQQIYAYVNSKEGEVEQWQLFDNENVIDARLVRQFKLTTQVEGMVADDEHRMLFVGEENKGIWKFDAEPDGSTVGKKLNKTGEEDNENIRYDVEGLTLYHLPGGKGYLLASSQGNNSYAVFNRRAPHRYLGSFRVVDGAVDGTEETDGIAVFSTPLNEDFPHGLLVIQDGYNKDDGKAVPQNFKLVAWEDISKPLKLDSN